MNPPTETNFPLNRLSFWLIAVGPLDQDVRRIKGDPDFEILDLIG